MNPARTALMTVAAGAGLAGVVLTHSGAATGLALGAPATAGAGAASGHAASTHPSANTAGNARRTPAPKKKHKHKATTPTHTATAAAGGVRSATGQGVNYGYGVLVVRVTVNGKRITNVTVPQLQVAEQYSQQLASQVLPMLKNEAMSAQSAKIAAISGATYTSEAYAMSLQSALRKLHI